MPKDEKEIYCSFCGKPQDMVGRIISGNGVYICEIGRASCRERV